MSGARPLRVGIDGTSLASRRGYGRFLRELLPPLAEAGACELSLLVDRQTAEDLAPLPARVVPVATSTGQASAASALGHRSLRDLLAMRRAAAAASLDVLFYPTVYSFFPAPARLPVLLGIHDVIAEEHGAVVFPNASTRLRWQAKVAFARRQARRLLTVSEWSRRRLAERFRIAPGRISVAAEAPSAVFRPADDPGPRRAWLAARGVAPGARYWIYVGGFNPHKNLPCLIEAFAASRAGGRTGDPWLLLVGDGEGDVFHADLPRLHRAIARCGVADRVVLPGFVPDAELRHLYAGAVALVLPSLEEGFGLAAVEAAACGTPCVATSRSPLPELLAGAGLFPDPRDVAAWRAALDRMAVEPGLRARLAARSVGAAAALSWERTAAAVRGAIEATAAGGAA